MNPIHIIETQSTDAQFMSCLPKACGDRPYEIIDNQVIVHDEDKKIIKEKMVHYLERNINARHEI